LNEVAVRHCARVAQRCLERLPQRPIGSQEQRLQAGAIENAPAPCVEAFRDVVVHKAFRRARRPRPHSRTQPAFGTSDRLDAGTNHATLRRCRAARARRGRAGLARSRGPTRGASTYASSVGSRAPEARSVSQALLAVLGTVPVPSLHQPEAPDGRILGWAGRQTKAIRVPECLNFAHAQFLCLAPRCLVDKLKMLAAPLTLAPAY
jgi:hypothetical protein